MASETNKRASAERAASALQDQAADFVAGAADGVRDAASSATEMAGDLYDSVAQHARTAVSAAPTSRAEAERILLRGRQRVGRRVRRQPVEALLLAGAVGYLVGWATSRG